MLDEVCEGVRAYLHSRTDTIRCIVESITDDFDLQLTTEVTEGRGGGGGGKRKRMFCMHLNGLIKASHSNNIQPPFYSILIITSVLKERS